jgi:hypothetical protein
MNLFVTFCLKRNFITTLEHDTFAFHLGWEIFYLTVDQITLKIFNRVQGLTLSYSSPNHLLCRYVFKRSASKTFICKILIIHLTIPESVLTATFLQLEQWFRVAGLPATSRFLSTSTHYLERWLRNRQYLEVCMHQWQVSRLWRQFTSLTFDQRIPWSVRHQNIYSHFTGCAWYFENHWHYWWSLSRLLTVHIIDW